MSTLCFTKRKTGNPAGPLGHALHSHLGVAVGYRWAKCYAGPVHYAPVKDGAVFDPDHPRACPKCRAIVRREQR